MCVCVCVCRQERLACGHVQQCSALAGRPGHRHWAAAPSRVNKQASDPKMIHHQWHSRQLHASCPGEKKARDPRRRRLCKVSQVVLPVRCTHPEHGAVSVNNHNLLNRSVANMLQIRNRTLLHLLIGCPQAYHAQSSKACFGWTEKLHRQEITKPYGPVGIE